MNEGQEPFEYAPSHVQWATPRQELLLGMIRGFVPGLWLGLLVVLVLGIMHWGWPDFGLLP
ncbi:hypothetical protein [Kocuria massiliensis]|uniref:hypothetical protein n=1 Tax=Kocuria massiliensis TaxID=1926282 RepID=UPI000A1CC0C3|nr:hypothetical protein [Kocuria massiliensis]